MFWILPMLILVSQGSVFNTHSFFFYTFQSWIFNALLLLKVILVNVLPNFFSQTKLATVKSHKHLMILSYVL